jgi:hypothetical protein
MISTANPQKSKAAFLVLMEGYNCIPLGEYRVVLTVHGLVKASSTSARGYCVRLFEHSMMSYEIRHSVK